MSTVITVTGPKDSSELGITLTHEHLVNDASSWAAPTAVPGVDPEEFMHRPVSADILWELRNDPFGNLDNCRLDDPELALQEIRRYAALGGRTIIDTTSMNSGRDLGALRELSERSGITVVAGTGYYLDPSLPRDFSALHAEDVAEQIVTDLLHGEDGVRPGIIGEIGVSADFTELERTSLIGACLAQRESGLPIEVHLPAWFRRGHEVLDIAEAQGVDPRAIVLCHMGPSGADRLYQRELLRRGAWVQYDMIGMEVFYADQGVQCPSDDENARNLLSLVEAGFGERLLISQDIFLKSLLRAHGGPGYGHILQYFVPRLRRHGADDATIDRLLVDNPRSLFDECARTSPGGAANGTAAASDQ
ncbi:phosphotriesterase family protein [Leucobacter celer]|uniref:phosphotriesterase family protein n=1 Tax=Leucobacter celer TaxID=668625 RepID=UPI0006A77E91|nr:phosphotriesterase [Leucobacter celer]